MPARKRPDLAARNRRPRPDLAARNRGEGVRLYEDPEWLRVRYFDDIKSFQEMAIEAGCGIRTIARWFHAHGFVAPSNTERRELRGNTLRGERSPHWAGGPPQCGCGRRISIYATSCRGCRDQTGANNGRWVGDGIGYARAHGRVVAARGRASRHACVTCGKPAAHWAYDHTDPAEKVDPSSDGPYSLDVSRYQPMCVRCHKRFDLARK